MSEFITDRDLSSIGETNMAAYAGLTITDGGVCLQRTELPQAVTVAGALSNEGDEITADEAQSLTFEELKKKLGVSDADNVGSSFLSETRFDPRTDTGLSLDEVLHVSQEQDPVVFLSFVDGEMWSEKKQAETIETLQSQCKEKGVSITFVTKKPESGKYSTVYVGSASVLKAYGADEDLSKQDYSDGVAYADTDMGRFGNKDIVLFRELNAIAEQINQLTSIDLRQEDTPRTIEYAFQDNESSPIVYLSFVDGEMWSEKKQARTIELLQGRCKEKGVSVTFVTEKPESGKYSTVYVGAASVLKAYGADEDLSKQDYSDGVAYADTDMGLFGVRDYIWPTEVDAIAEQIKGVTDIDLIIPKVITPDLLLRDDDTTVTDTTDTTVTDYHYGQDNWSIGENGELVYKDTTKYIKFTSADLPFCLSLIDNRGRMMGDMDPPGQESTPPDVTLEDLTPVLIPVSSDLLQKFEEAKSLRQRLSERSNPIAFVSTMDAETAAVTSVQVASAEDGGWRTIGTLNNPDGIDWKYQAGNLTGSGTASVVWHAQELGALGVWTDGTDNWTAVDGWFDTNWTMLGCGDFDGDGKDSVLMSLNGGLFYS
ncbi:MAG: hypothetical protein PUC15_06200, partial [Lentisphaeria bacterium]|nr:hypothetical protein [Lentisphaeria bacterium]